MAFEIDDRKLRRSTTPPDGEWWEGFKWSGWIIGVVALFIGSAALLVAGVLRAFA